MNNDARALAIFSKLLTSLQSNDLDPTPHVPVPVTPVRLHIAIALADIFEVLSSPERTSP